MRSVLMVVPDAFHLGWMGATRRVFHIAWALRSFGFDVTLLGGRWINPDVQSKIDEEFPGHVIRTGHSGDYPSLFEGFSLLRRAWRATWKLRGEDVYWSKLSWGWADRLDVEWVISKLRENGKTPVLVWGVTGGYLEGAVAAERIAAGLGVPWILELHDPPRRAGLGPENRRVRSCFHGLLRSAACVVVTAASYADQLEREYGKEIGRIYVVHLTYAGKPREVVHAGDEFRLVYAGSLDGGRSLSPVLYALKQASIREAELARFYRLVLAGEGPGFGEARRLARDLGISELLEFRGLLSGRDVEGLVASASAVVIIQESTNILQIPGKVFECLRAKKPIIGIMPQECEAAVILRRSGLGFIHEKEDIHGLCDTLIHLWQAWRYGRQVVEPDDEYIEQFCVDRLPARLREVLKGSGVYMSA